MVVLLFFCCSLSISTIRQYPCVCVVHLLPGRLYDSSTLHVQFVHSFFEKRNAYTQFITLYTDMQLHCTVRNGSVHTSIFAFILPCQVDLFFVVLATSTLYLLQKVNAHSLSVTVAVDFRILTLFGKCRLCVCWARTSHSLRVRTLCTPRECNNRQSTKLAKVLTKSSLSRKMRSDIYECMYFDREPIEWGYLGPHYSSLSVNESPKTSSIIVNSDTHSCCVCVRKGPSLL